MKSTLKKSALLALAFGLLNAGAARASTIEVNVPFSFQIHGKTMPAGAYRVEREGSDVLLIRGTHNNQQAAAFVMTMPAEGRDPSHDRPALTFARHETQYRLSTIWESGNDGLTVIGK
jgi:hypothetical protein